MKPGDRQRTADICVVGGAGHVGLPLSLVFASKNRRVCIYDTDGKAIESIARGVMPFMEDGAEPLLKEALAKGNLAITDSPAEAAGIPVIIITIGTPVDEFHSPTTKYIQACLEELFPFLDEGQLIIIRSTVYPGVTDWTAKFLRSRGKNINVACCPERIVQGHAIRELEELPQIVSGTSQDAEEAAAQLFGLITDEIVRLSPMEAEFAKLFCNAYRYIEFAAANQFYMITASAGVDYYRVLSGLKKNYSRAQSIPKAGFAAGPCLFKDTMQLSAFFRNQFSLGYSALLVNEGLPIFVLDMLKRLCQLDRSTVGLLGMAFKADNDDPRSSLSYKMKKLLAFHAKSVLTTDPYVRNDPELVPIEKVIAKADVLVLCTPHSSYRDVDLKGKPVLDIWNFLPASRHAA